MVSIYGLKNVFQSASHKLTLSIKFGPQVSTKYTSKLNLICNSDAIQLNNANAARMKIFAQAG